MEHPRSWVVFCRLEAVPVAYACVSMIVVAEHMPALRQTLESIALQTATPLDVNIAIRQCDAEVGRALAKSILPSRTAVAVSSTDDDVWALVPRLIDHGAGAAIAIVVGGDVLAPGFLASALARFGAADGDTIAAVAISHDSKNGTAMQEADDEELPLSAILCSAGLRATCFVYRREAMERVGGWPLDMPMAEARLDMHLRLALEWRIGLLPSRLAEVAAEIPCQDKAELTGFNAVKLRQMLRQAPGHLGLLMSIARESASNREREAGLHSRIDLLSRQVKDLQQMVRNASA